MVSHCFFGYQDPAWNHQPLLSCFHLPSHFFSQYPLLFSQLPFFPGHLPIFDRYDSFVMHVLIPLLGIGSFLINDSPIGRLTPKQRWQGTWFVSYYAVNILILIGTGLLPAELIPYPFLNYRENGWGVFFAAFVFVYGCGYLMGWALSEWNRKLSWLWFKDIAKAR